MIEGTAHISHVPSFFGVEFRGQTYANAGFIHLFKLFS
jgi:hypothetical protein